MVRRSPHERSDMRDPRKSENPDIASLIRATLAVLIAAKGRFRGRYPMVDLQVRGPGGIAGNYGFGIFGINYGISGGTNGIQFQGQISAFGLAASVARMSAAICGIPGNQKTRISLRSSGLCLLALIEVAVRSGGGHV
jgi:hypothetical protein